MLGLTTYSIDFDVTKQGSYMVKLNDLTFLTDSLYIYCFDKLELDDCS